MAENIPGNIIHQLYGNLITSLFDVNLAFYEFPRCHIGVSFCDIIVVLWSNIFSVSFRGVYGFGGKFRAKQARYDYTVNLGWGICNRQVQANYGLTGLVGKGP